MMPVRTGIVRQDSGGGQDAVGGRAAKLTRGAGAA
ncbi:hypothetical protein VT85_21675 [Planctomyces sp. SH-PL62]|nr:hypothetical protein VT85_21675 [Planctomyces sp. SH-PL62]